MPEIEILDVNWSPSDPQSGESIEFEVEVENTTSSTIDSIGVLVYVDDEISHVPPNFSLEPGEDRWTVKTGNNSFDPGQYDARAVIDHVDGSLDEYDEYEFSISVGSDLGWVEGTVSSSTGDSIDGYRVDLRGDNISTRQTRVDDGSFDFDGVPPGDYQLRGYMVGYEGFEENITVSENSGTTVDKTVSPEPHELTVDMTDGGGVGINPPGVSTFEEWTEEYDRGTEITVFANPDSGYEFVEWMGDVSDLDADSEEIAFEIEEDKEIIGTFEEEGSTDHTLTVNVGSGGGVGVSPPGVSTADEWVESYEAGTAVTVTANPDSGYEFDEWVGDIPTGASKDESISLDMDMARQITVLFEAEHEEVALTLSVEGDGEITILERGETVESGEITVSEGDEYTLIAEPGDDAEFQSWDGPVDDFDNETTTIEVNESTHVTAEFADVEAKPDLSIDDVSVDDPLAGNDVAVDVQLVNTGVGGASDPIVAIDVADETFSAATSEIGAGEETTVTVEGWRPREPGSVDVTVTVSLDGEEESGDIDTFSVDVEEPPTDLEVLVRSARGDEITGATVTIESGTDRQTERTNPGSATFSNISPGEYTVNVEDGGLYQTLEEDSIVEFGENTHFAMFDPVDPVTGFVMYADGEAGIEDATVTIPSVDASTTTDEEGWFEISDEIPDGEYAFEISLPDGEVITREVELDATRVVPIETDVSADLDVDGEPETVEEDNLLVSSVYKYILSNPEVLFPGKSPWGLYGTLNGFESAISFYIDSISTLVNDVGLSGIVDMIRGLFSWPDVDLSMVFEIVQMMVRNLLDEQESDNPYDPDEQSRRYTVFKRGWFEGYVLTHVAVELLISRGVASASRAVTSTATFQRGADRVNNTIRMMNEATPSGEAARNAYHRIARRDGGDVSVSFPTAQLILDSDNPVLFDRVLKGYHMMTDRRRGTIQNYESPLGIASRNLAGELAEVYHIQRLMQRRDDIISVVGNVTEAGRDLTLASLPVGKTLLVRKVEVEVRDRDTEVQEDSFEFDAAEVTKESETTGGRFDSNERITLWEVNSGSASMTQKVNDAAEHVERIQSALQATDKEVIVRTSGLTGRHFRSGNVEVKGAGTRDSASYPDQNGHEIDYWDDPEVRDGDFGSIGGDIQENENLFGVLDE